MDKKCIISKNAPPAVGPYSHAVEAGNLLFVSGQIPISANNTDSCENQAPPEVLRGTIEEETRLALNNLSTLLKDCGSGLEKVIKTTVFLSSIDDFPAFNEVYKEFFVSDCPARSCVEVSRLPLGVKVEIEAIAISS